MAKRGGVEGDGAFWREAPFEEPGQTDFFVDNSMRTRRRRLFEQRFNRRVVHVLSSAILVRHDEGSTGLPSR